MHRLICGSTRLVVLLAIALACPAQGAALQAPSPVDRDAVLATIQEFFDAMTVRDAGRARRVLMPEGRFYALEQQEGKTVIRTFTHQEYLQDIRAIGPNVRERMWAQDVRVRGVMATVWTPYDFWSDGKFSHCGIDVFDLIRTNEGWKIAGGTYTIEHACDPSPLGPLTPKKPQPFH